MSPEPNPPKRPSWRGGAVARPRDAKRSSWQEAPRTSAPGYERSNFWRRVRLVSVSLLALGLVAAVIWALLSAPSKVNLVALAVGDGYRFPLPPNGWIREDLARFAQLTTTFRITDQSARENDVETAADWAPAALARRLAAPLDRDRGSRQAALLYLSAHGAVRMKAGQAEPCLIPPGLEPAQVLEDERWVSVVELTKALAAEPALRNRLTVLVLDVGKLGEPWPLGVFDSTFPGALAGEAKDLPQPPGGRLWLLTSVDDAQTAWTSPTLGGSVFGYYTARALAGDADREGDGDRSVTAAELRDYLRRRVDAWAVTNRAARQTPRFVVPPDQENELATAALVDVDPSPPTLAGSSAARRAESQAGLDAIWRDAQPLAAQAACYAPVQWQELLRRMLWAEQLSQAGAAYSAAATEAAGDNETLLARLKKLLPKPDAQPDSLAASRVAEPTATEAAWRRWEALALTTEPALDGSLRQSVQAFASETTTPRPAAERVFVSQLLRQLDSQTWGDEPLVRAALAAVGRREQLAAEFPNGSSTTVANDPRVTAWIAAPLAEHDQRLRAALDSLMVGAAGSREAASTGLREAGEQFTALSQRGRTAAEAYALCDEIWAEAPYTAAWHAQRLSPDANWRTELSALAQGVDQLAQLLYERGPGAAPLDEIAAKTRELRTRWTAFQAPLADEWQALQPQEREAAVEARVQPEQLRRIGAALAAPQTPAAVRPKLRSEWLKLDARLQQAFAQAKPADEAIETPPPNADSMARAAGELWRLPSSGAFDGSAADGTKFRQALLAMSRAEGPWRVGVRQADAALSASGDLPQAVGDERLGAAEREVRMLAAALPTAADDPVVGRQMALRGADRAVRAATWRMDDFWGPMAESQPPFFADAAAARLQAARERLVSSLRLGDAVIDRLLPGARLSALREVAEAPLVNLESSRIENAQGAVTPVSLEMRSRVEPSLGIAGDVALRVVVREGEAWRPVDLWLESQQDQGDVGRAYPLASPVSDVLAVPTTAVTGHGIPQAEVWFRGFVTPHPLGTPSASQRAITIRYPEPEPASVRVDGSLRKRAQVMFVLDCSRSMEATVPGRGRRLIVAWDAIMKVVRELANRDQYDIGLRKYAHRYDFEHFFENGQERYRTSVVVDGRDPAKPRVQNAQLQQPATDSEVVLKMQRFGRNDVRRFEALKPEMGVGVTPLYFSISEALSDFPKSDEPKFLVVLTDGADGVHRLNSTGREPTASADLDKLASELEQSGVQLHVVGFAVEGEAERNKWDSFREWVAKHGGETYDAANPDQLSAALNKALGLNEFTVTDLADSQATFRGLLGDSTQIPLADCRSDREWEAASEARSQAVKSDPFVVRGGEYLHLEIDDADERIDFRRFDERKDDVEVGPTPETDGWRLGCWRDLPRVQPREEAGLATFFAWMQKEDPQREKAVFSPRPQLAYVELTPYDNDKREPRGDRYVFFDAPFVPRVEVPMLELGAPNWPSGCEMAKVEMWLRFDDPPAALRQSLQNLPADGRLRLEGSTPGLEGVSLRVRVDQEDGVGRVTIDERWSNPPEGFRPLAILVEPAPSEVRHVYGDGNRTATHEFLYDRVQEGWRGDKEIVVVPFAALRQSAIATPEPLWVAAPAPR